MSEDMHHVAFRDAEVGNLTSIAVTTEQAEQILAAREGDCLPLSEGRWIRLQPGDPTQLENRVFHYHHGSPGGYGYVQAFEHDLRTGLVSYLATLTGPPAKAD